MDRIGKADKTEQADKQTTNQTNKQTKNTGVPQQPALGVGSSTNTERDKELRPPPPALPAHKQQVKGPNLDQKFDVLPLLATG